MLLRLLLHSPDVVVVHFCTSECFLFLVVLSCLLQSCHVPALTDALTASAQDSSQKSQRIVHPCSRIFEPIADVPNTTDLGAERHWIKTQISCAWSRSIDSMATNMAEVLEFAARSTPCDNDERTWLMFRLKIENYFSLVKEKCVALLQDVESQTVANVPAETDEASVLIRTLSRTLYALLVTLTAGRSLRLSQRLGSRSGFEPWRQLVTQNAAKTAGRRLAMLQAMLQPV